MARIAFWSMYATEYKNQGDNLKGVKEQLSFTNVIEVNST
jgi:hypothetical protein